MSQARPLNVGLIGLGTVGSQIAERMLTWGPQLSRRAGVELCLQKVLVREVTKRRSIDISPDLLTADPDAILDDPKVEVVMEVAGGDEPMRSYIERAIQAGKHVITANKVVMAKHGPELLDQAAEKNVDVYFEAAVGGGIPLISTFRTDLQANRIESVSAVINGTTNYVLGRMAAAGLSMADAVREAQDAGYAEADPTEDVGGYDATYKLAILASIAYEIKVRPDEIYREGIEGIEPVDFRYARELGYAIKLIAHTQRHPGRVEARVHPALVSLEHPLARVEGAENAVFVEGDLVGQVLLVGPGAGGGSRGSEGRAPSRGPRYPHSVATSTWGPVGAIASSRDRLPVGPATPEFALGEGSTPLVPSHNIGRALGLKHLYFKYEGLNPTGSFKDRGMVVAVAKALEGGSHVFMCASTGNTSASMAAYAARTGARAIVVVPSGAGPAQGAHPEIALNKLSQALMYGAKVVALKGNFDHALETVRDLTSRYPVALMNSVNPHRIEGQKTAAFEIVDALGDAPDYLVLPVGNAGNITAYWRGFREYQAAGRAARLPRMVGAQAEGAAPIVNGSPVANPR